MTQSIADAIKSAQDAAAAQVSAGALSTQMAGGTAVGAHVESGAPLGLDDMLSGGVAVDHWIKLTPYGMVIAGKTDPQKTIDVFLEMGAIAYCYQVKYQLNGQAKYHRSYDRRTEAGGGSWMDTIRQAQQIDAKAYEYRSAEIPLISAADIKGQDGTVVVKAGETLGLTLPTTGWKPFEAFVKDAARKGISVKDATLKMTLGFEVKKKQGVNDWAIPAFASYEEVDVLPVFDETVH